MPGPFLYNYNRGGAGEVSVPGTFPYNYKGGAGEVSVPGPSPYNYKGGAGEVSAPGPCPEVMQCGCVLLL